MSKNISVDLKKILRAACLAALLGMTLTSCSPEPEPIRALLVTGGGWHDYETQEGLLIDGISERVDAEVEWTVMHEGDGEPDHHVSIFEQENWAEGYDVVVHNTGFGRVMDSEFVAQLVNGHSDMPAVLIHATVHSYRYAEPADPWFEFIGLQSMYHEAQRPFEVENMAPDHPIMAGFPETWLAPTDEVYVIEREWGNITPLARAYGEETDTWHVTSWTHEADGIRLFATTLGHNNETFEEPVFLDKVANGFRWAANIEG